MNNNTDNQVSNNNSVSPKNNSKIVLATILAIIAVALATYLVYDKVLNKDEMLSNDEALKIGNELYAYANGNYGMDSELIKWATPDGKHPDEDEEPVDLGDDYGDAYEITNYDEIMRHFSKECKRVCWDYTDSKDQESEQSCEKDLPFVTKNDKHYAIDELGGGNVNIAYVGDLKVKNKTSNKITFTIDYAYCYTDNDEETVVYYDQVEETKENKNKCVVLNEDGDSTGELLNPSVFTKDFVIVKEDGNWKILKYYNDNSRPCSAQ